MKIDPPTTCPQCHQETAKRLISGGSGKGTVEVYGQELKEKLVAEGAAYRKEVYASENKYANFIGEDRYQSIQSSMDRRPKAERPFFTSKKS
jgi:hypothetical protein